MKSKLFLLTVVGLQLILSSAQSAPREVISFNIGQVTLPLSEQASGSLSLPSMTMDLQKLTHRRWMQSVQLQVLSGSYSKDSFAETTDTSAGSINLSLRQSLLKRAGWDWGVGQSLGWTAKFEREFHGKDFVFEGNPLNFAVNTQLSKRLNRKLTLITSSGAFYSIPRPQDTDPVRLQGVSADIGLQWQGQFGLGVLVNKKQMVGPGIEPSEVQAVNTSAYAKYTVAQKQVLQASLENINDTINNRADGSARQGRKISVSYQVEI